MKKLAFLILSTILFAACTLEDSDNGDLDGYWHLTRVDTVATGGTKDLSKESLFWAIQGKLLYLRDNNDIYKECISHFKVEGDSLYVLDAYYYDRENSDPSIKDVASLQPYGINTLSEDFRIMKLTKSKMVLLSNTVCLYLRKL